MTAPSRRPPLATSSIRRTEDARPAASGSTACGKRTLPRKGRMPRTSGTGRSLSRLSSLTGIRLRFSEEIEGSELAGGGANKRLPRRTPLGARRLAAPLPEVADQVLDLLLHVDHASSHL